MVPMIHAVIVLIGLYLVRIETRAHIASGIGRPGLRTVGWILAGFGGLGLLGSILGR